MVAAADAVGLPYVVIGGFSVIANGFVRATKDSDLLVPDGPDADSAILRFLERIEATRLSDDKSLTEDEVMAAEHIRVRSRHGIVDLLRGGSPPLDFETVAARAIEGEVGGARPSSPPCAASSASSVLPGARRTAATSKNSKPSTASSP